MYIHLGNNAVIKTQDIIGIFDLDNTTVQKRTRDFLKKAERDGKIVITSNELPKSFVLTGNKKGEKKVYLSFLSPNTLLKRSSYIKKQQFKEKNK